MSLYKVDHYKNGQILKEFYSAFAFRMVFASYQDKLEDIWKHREVLDSSLIKALADSPEIKETEKLIARIRRMRTEALLKGYSVKVSDRTQAILSLWDSAHRGEP